MALVSVSFVFVMIQLVHSFYITTDGCAPIDKCPYKTDQDQLKVFSKGLINQDTESPYSMDYLYCLNHYFECGYMLKEYENISTIQNGVYFGLGINLGNLTTEFYDKLQNKPNIFNNLGPFIGLSGSDAFTKLNSSKFNLTEDEIGLFNEISLEYLFNKTKSAYLLQDYLKIMSLTMPLLSLYLKNGDDFPSIGVYSRQREFEYVGYSLENLQGGEVFERKKQSMVINSLNNTCDSNHYINFLIDQTFDDTNWQTMKEIIQEIAHNLPSNHFAISLFGKESSNELPFTSDYEVIKTTLSNIKYQKVANSSLISGLSSIEQNFNGIAKLEYEIEKILFIFITSIQNENLDIIKNKLVKLNENGIRVILFGKISSSITQAILEKINQRPDNIFILNSFEAVLDNNKMPIKSLISSICLQHVVIQLNTGAFISGNYKITMFKSKDYFRVVCEKNKSYIIELWIKEEDYQGLNVFGSILDPYPDINSHIVKHLGLRKARERPRIIINSTDSNEFYLTVMSNYLIYSLNITQCDDTKDEPASNGEFSSNDIKKFDDIYSFFNCYRKSCFLQDDQLLKYYARGIQPQENIEPYSYHSELFHCLIPFYTCGYYSNNNSAYNKSEGVKIGLEISLKKLSNTDLFLEYNLPFILINKMHNFLEKNKKEIESDSSIDFLQRENLNFTWNETELIYWKLIKEKITILTKDFQVNDGVLKFDQVNDNIRFLLLTRYFLKNHELTSEEIVNISSQNYEGYLKGVMSIPDSNLDFIKNVNILLFQSAFHEEKEKILLYFIIGKSYLYSNEIEDLYKFIDEICHNNTKLSMGVYDTNQNKLNLVFNFGNKTSQLKADLTNYIDKNPKEYSGSSNGASDTLNLDIIFEATIKQFNTYDKGIKKILMVYAYENKPGINNLISHSPGTSWSMLENEGINTLLLTSMHQQSKYLNSIKAIKKENMFHLLDMRDETKRKMVIKAIRFTHIPLMSTCRIYTDFYKNTPVYFEITKEHQSDSSTLKQIIKLNKANLVVYTSTTFPYPCNYSNEGVYTTDTFKISIPFNKTSLFIGIVPKDEDVQKVKLELYHYHDDVSSQTRASGWLVSLILVSGMIVILYTIYTFYYDTKKEKRKTNIFD